jgi:hypothetical protein
MILFPHLKHDKKGANINILVGVYKPSNLLHELLSVESIVTPETLGNDGTIVASFCVKRRRYECALVTPDSFLTTISSQN